MRRARLTAALAASLGIPAAPALAQGPPPPGCPVPAGHRVVLASVRVDPNVFVWDSRGMLVDFEAGDWGGARAIFAHTMLASPGTRAIVVSCFPGVAHPRAGGDEDAVGVKMISGPFRGRYGWALSSDVHVVGGERAIREPTAANAIITPRR